MGVKYRFYQFVYTGDFIQFVQAYDNSTDSWDWLVTNSMGVFSNSLNVTGGGGNISMSTGATDYQAPGSGLNLTS